MLLGKTCQRTQYVLSLLQALGTEHWIHLWVTVARRRSADYHTHGTAVVIAWLPVDTDLPPCGRSPPSLTSCIGHDTVESGRESPSWAEASNPPVGQQEAVMYDVLGRRSLANQQVSQAQSFDLIVGYQGLESTYVATLAAMNGLAVVIEAHNDPF